MDMQSASTAAADEERQPLLEQDVNKPKEAPKSNAKPKKQRSNSEAVSASVTAGTTPSSAAVEGNEASAANSQEAADAPRGKINCDLCVASPYESATYKAAKYATFMLAKHKKQHHSTRVSFTTWLLHHHQQPKCYSCPVCRKAHSSTQHLQLHLLQAHWDDVPDQLPASIFRLAYDACLSSGKAYTKRTALKYRSVVEQLPTPTAAEGYTGGGGEDSGSQQ